MKVKEFIATAKEDGVNTLYFQVETQYFDVIFTKGAVLKVVEQIPNLMERDVVEWEYYSDMGPYDFVPSPENNANTMRILVK